MANDSSKPKRTWWRPLALVVLIAGLVPLAVMVIARHTRNRTVGEQSTGPTSSGAGTIPAPQAARLVGRESCGECHSKALKAWRGSDHDQAMQVATDQTVRADFNDTSFTRRGKTSRFFRRGERFFVNTEGPDEKVADFEIKYTFGVRPLQQYMVPFPDGRVQVLTIAWDTERRRWFYQYPGHTPVQERALHWTGPFQNWNFMCAECHSTGLHKNYDLQTNTYQTSWHEIDVSCEACHGPASNHLFWAKAKKRGRQPPPWAHTGFSFTMSDEDRAAWVIDKKTGMAKRSKPRLSHAEVELCARCHSRRSVVEERYEFGKPLMNTHRPALLDGLLYHPDGQIDDEVFVYGSFLQSKMYGAGVTCNDCHDPHALSTRGSVDQVCARCHLDEKFASGTHHFHKPGSSGSRCIGCHMPKKRYMVVDPRGDHSFRVPRPDLSVRLGTPNACTNEGCHADKSAQWAADANRKWYGPALERKAHYGQVLYAARRGDPQALPELTRLIWSREALAIVRATAISLLPNYAGFPLQALLRGALADANGLVRRAAVGVAALYPASARLELITPLLDDPLRAVRIEAGRALGSVPPDNLNSAQRNAIKPSLAEYERVQHINRDRGASHINLAVLHIQRGELAAAERAYRTALRIQPDLLGAYINLADLYRSQGRDERGAEVLARALAINPENADVHHAIGLLRARQKDTAGALAALRRAAELDPENPRNAYVYAVALNSAGHTAQAMETVRTALQKHPFDRQLLLASTTLHRDAHHLDEAIRYGQRLVALAPRNPQFRALLRQLRESTPRP